MAQLEGNSSSPTLFKTDRAMEELKALGKLINDSIVQLEKICSSNSTPFPSLQDPFSPQGDAFRRDLGAQVAANNIIAAANQAIALVRDPSATAYLKAAQFQVSAALRFAVDTHVPEILREAGPQGLSVEDIARKNGVDSKRLGRVLRFLATEHIFQEISPDVFANNRISSSIDTGKPVADILAKPLDKHVGTSGSAAVVSHLGDWVFKASSYMTDIHLDGDEWATSQKPTESAFNRAHDTELNFFSWLGKSERELKVFSMAMEGTKGGQTPGLILKGFNWNDLPDGSLLVDVGSGVGSQSIEIARANPRLKFVLQDLGSTLENGRGFWKERYPEALDRVTFLEHDFFHPQPVKDAAVFFLRFILHDWSDPYCLSILKSLREAAAPTTKLILMERLMSHACRDTTPAANIPGASEITPDPPEPLLPNYGYANIVNYLVDMTMMVLFNSQERTIGHLDKLLREAGWKLERVYPPFGMHDTCQILAVPFPSSE